MKRDSYSFWGLFPVHVLRQAPVLSVLARCIRSASPQLTGASARCADSHSKRLSVRPLRWRVSVLLAELRVQSESLQNVVWIGFPAQRYFEL